MTASDRAIEMVATASLAAAEKLAEELVALDVSEQLVITDAFLVASGNSERHVSSIVDGIEEALHKIDAKPLRREGQHESRWVLLDYGEIVIHVQHAEDRVYYALERLWRDCPAIPLPEAATHRPES